MNNLEQLRKDLFRLIAIRRSMTDDIFNDFLEYKEFHVTATGAIRDSEGSSASEFHFEDYVFNVQPGLFHALRSDIIKLLNGEHEAAAIAEIKKLKLPLVTTMQLRPYYQRQLERCFLLSLEKIRERIKVTTPSMAPTRKFVELLTGTPAADEDVYALAHSLWMVKRGVFHLSRQDHQMLCFLGNQGVGKSTAIELLFKPLEELTKHTALDRLRDSSALHSFNYYKIQLLEELAGANRSDIESLKDIITNPKPSDRMRYNALMSEFDNRATFFGSTNRPIASIFYDTTGMRRFYELTVSDDLRLRWPQLNAFDFVALWQSIDETLATGYLSGKFENIGKKVAKKKEINTAEDLKEMFITDMNIKYSANMEYKFVPNSVTIKSFHRYLDREGLGNTYGAKSSAQAFSYVFRRMGFIATKEKGTRGWLLNKSCYLNTSDELKEVSNG